MSDHSFARFLQSIAMLGDAGDEVDQFMILLRRRMVASGLVVIPQQSVQRSSFVLRHDFTPSMPDTPACYIVPSNAR